ncbi:MAG: ubiquitin-like protein UBact [Candidatus Aenigmarchaeota archaeon]|nr:ubiquitin-like protein UBact [Candidatus Aenigmarchaeota archaeon]
MGAYESFRRTAGIYPTSEEPGRRERPSPVPYPTDDGGGSGPRSADRYDDLRRRSQQIIDKMRQTDPKTAERYRQRQGE